MNSFSFINFPRIYYGIYGFIESIITYFLNGPTVPSWSIFYHILFGIIRKYTFNLTYENLTLSRIKFTLLSLPLRRSKSKKIKIPNKFRQLAKDYVKAYFFNRFGDEFWYSDDLDWTASRDLRAEWVIPNHLTLDKANPVLIYFHGGGYVVGQFSVMRAAAERIVVASNCLGFGVDYRLSPEYTIPCMIEDALASFLYLTSKDPEGFGLDPSQIVIGGESAGGGLAAILSHFLRDNQLHQPAGVLLMSAFLDATHSLPSLLDNLYIDYLPPLNKAHPKKPYNENYNDIIWKKSYFGSNAKIRQAILDRGHPLGPYKFLNSPMISPLCDTNFKNLPPTLIECGDIELFRDEDVAYAQLIMDAHDSNDLTNRVILNVYEDMPHAFQHIMVTHPQVRRSFSRMANFLIDLLHNNGHIKEFKSKKNYIKTNGDCIEFEKETRYDLIPTWGQVEM